MLLYTRVCYNASDSKSLRTACHLRLRASGGCPRPIEQPDALLCKATAAIANAAMRLSLGAGGCYQSSAGWAWPHFAGQHA